MRKFLTLVLVFAVVLSVVPASFAAQLTDDQREQLNTLGAPSSIASARQTSLGDVLDAILGGGTSEDISSGATAIPVVDPTTNRPVTFVTVDLGSGSAFSIANGKVGQVLTVKAVLDGGSATVTPTTTTSFTSCTLADSGDTVTWQYVDDTVGWVVRGVAGTTVGGEPVCTI